MKRLLRVSFDILITSIIPIVSWFLLGIILDNSLINIFSLTYPLQCLMGMIVAVFGVGANISIYKDNPTNSEFISIIAEKLRLKLFDVQSVA